MAIHFLRFSRAALLTRPLNPGEQELYRSLCQGYAGRPTITLQEFLRDFMSGQRGKPMSRKTALNLIYRSTFPVPVLHDRVLIRDIAVWLYQKRTKQG